MQKLPKISIKSSLLTVIVARILLGTISCSEPNSTGTIYGTEKTEDKPKDACSEVPRVEWSHIESGYDKKMTLDLATKLQGAITADSKALKNIGKADASAKISLEVTKLFTEREYKEVNISQEVFDKGIQFRTTICNLWSLLKSGNLNDAQKDKVINEMLNYGKIFNNIEKKEKKNLTSE